MPTTLAGILHILAVLEVPVPRRKASAEPAVSALCPVCGARFAPSPGRRCAVCIMRAVEDRTGVYREFPDDPYHVPEFEAMVEEVCR